MSVTIQDKTGSAEVTVWPDILRNTEEIWSINSPVSVYGKVRGQGERLTVSCESVQTLDMNHNNSNVSINDTPENQTNVSTSEEKPVTNTHNESENFDSRKNDQTDEPRHPFKVTLELKETDNKDLDINVLTKLLGTLREFPGEDLIHLNIIVAEERVDLLLPDKAQFNEILEEQLEAIIGQGKISIQRKLI